MRTLRTAPLFLLVILTFVLAGTLAVCPDKASDLKPWSAPSSWPGNQLPSVNDNVTISSPILVDTTLPDLFSITVAAGGRLVFSHDRDHALSLHYILIEGNGEMHIGSEDCQFDKYVSISLLGEPGELDIPGFGEKFIGVKENGVLELHGADKLSWTKLSRTVQKADPSKLFKYNHREQDDTIMAPGIFVYRFNKSGVLLNSTHERLHIRQRGVKKAIQRLEKFMLDIGNDDVVAIATQKEVIKGRDLSALIALFDRVLGSHRFGDVVQDSAYAYIGIKGDGVKKEDLQFLNVQAAFASVSLTIPETNSRFVVESYNFKKREGRSYADFLVLDLAESEPVIDVVNDVSSWNTGDRIFITSTDYNWRQVEEFTKVNCPTCTATQIKLSAPAEYAHYGEIYKRVDMRAEVGLMTRHILIRGVVSKGNTNGGHVKFLKGFGSVRVEGVELTNMGQPLVLGRYPLHYHMCEDLSNTTLYPIRSYIRKNSIHHNQFRCVTIHGTHKAQLFDNVCYDTFGHGFFLEDGGEKYTHIEGNLGLGQKSWKGKIGKVGTTGTIPTDRKPVTFWLTNPLTIIKNNAAAGGDGVGMWFVYPDRPTGPSRALNFMGLKEARHTAVEEFDNNVAHSYVKAGLFVDNIEQDDLTVKGYNQYDPREIPTNFKSPRVRAIFNRLTAYKNKGQNAWIRGGWMVLRQSSLSDSNKGLSLIRENPHYLQFYDSVVIGESDNKGEPATFTTEGGTVVKYDRSIPMRVGDNRIGFNFFKGAAIVNNVWFGGFKNTPYYKMGAITASKCFFQSSFILQQTSNLKFGFDDSEATGNRVYVGDGQCDSSRGKSSMFRDTDSSLTDTSGSPYTVIRNEPFYVTGQCKFRSNWNMAYCPHTYGSVSAKYNADEKTTVMMRTDSPNPSQMVTGDTMNGFFVILGGDVSYLMYIEESLPSKLLIRGQGMTASKSLTLALCVPRDAKFNLKMFNSGKRIKLSSATSRTEVATDSTGSKYFFDSTIGVLIFKLTSQSDFGDGEFQTCPGGKCPMLKIEFTGGDLTDNDCSDRVKENDILSSPTQGSPLLDESVLASDGQDPPETWGAGRTFPFSA